VEILAWLQEKAGEWCMSADDWSHDDSLLRCIQDDIHTASDKKEFLKQFEAVTQVVFPASWAMKKGQKGNESRQFESMLGFIEEVLLCVFLQ